MKCPFCDKEGKPIKTTSGNRIECHCPHCNSLVAAYLEDMEQVLKNLISMERFERNTK